jgi:hypothetical protein
MVRRVRHTSIHWLRFSTSGEAAPRPSQFGSGGDFLWTVSEAGSVGVRRQRGAGRQLDEAASQDAGSEDARPHDTAAQTGEARCMPAAPAAAAQPGVASWPGAEHFALAKPTAGCSCRAAERLLTAAAASSSAADAARLPKRASVGCSEADAEPLWCHLPRSRWSLGGSSRADLCARREC